MPEGFRFGLVKLGCASQGAGTVLQAGAGDDVEGPASEYMSPGPLVSERLFTSGRGISRGSFSMLRHMCCKHSLHNDLQTTQISSQKEQNRPGAFFDLAEVSTLYVVQQRCSHS